VLSSLVHAEAVAVVELNLGHHAFGDFVEKVVAPAVTGEQATHLETAPDFVRKPTMRLPDGANS
jgi:hypothetical protein